MSKEQLEEIKEIEEEVSNGFAIDDLDLNFMTVVNRKHFNWLIEQAQRSLYLEEREKEIIDINRHETQYRQELESINMELNQQNKRYRDASRRILSVISSTYEYENELELSTALIKIADIIKELDETLEVKKDV